MHNFLSDFGDIAEEGDFGGVVKLPDKDIEGNSSQYYCTVETSELLHHRNQLRICHQLRMRPRSRSVSSTIKIKTRS